MKILKPKKLINMQYSLLVNTFIKIILKCYFYQSFMSLSRARICQVWPPSWPYWPYRSFLYPIHQTVSRVRLADSWWPTGGSGCSRYSGQTNYQRSASESRQQTFTMTLLHGFPVTNQPIVGLYSIIKLLTLHLWPTYAQCHINASR